MGMFNDGRNASREQWKYDYKGSELLPFARAKLKFYTERETELRDIIAKRMADRALKSNSTKNDSLRKKIEAYGAERERCLVWVHEFDRNPDRVYQLSLGDVTYFDIASIPNAEGPDEEDDF